MNAALGMSRTGRIERRHGPRSPSKAVCQRSWVCVRMRLYTSECVCIPALQRSTWCTASCGPAKHGVSFVIVSRESCSGAFRQAQSVRLTPTVGCQRSPCLPSTSDARSHSSTTSPYHSLTITLNSPYVSFGSRCGIAPYSLLNNATSPARNRIITTQHNSRQPNVARLFRIFGGAPSVSPAGEVAAAMDERESSTASSVDFYETDKRVETPPKEPQNDTATKRKAEELVPSPEKKRKLESPSPTACTVMSCAGLPAAVWQHVFLSCSLYDLGRLLQVNRAFRSYLTDVRNFSLHDPHSGSLRLLKSDSLWASARNALPVKPPKPLQGFSELQMWQLAWSKRCQFCRKESSSTPSDKVWQQGPGADGVRTIWTYGIKCCGTCLLARCKTVRGT